MLSSGLSFRASGWKPDPDYATEIGDWDRVRENKCCLLYYNTLQ